MALHDIVLAEAVEMPPATKASGRWPRLAMTTVLSAVEWLTGLVSLVLLLAILASLPLLNLLSLGYLLEVSGRVARSGRLRDGFVGIRRAARLGTIALASLIWLLPVQVAASMWRSSILVSGADSDITRGWRIATIVLTLLICGHLAWACFRGGRLRHFLWPAPVKLLRTLVRGGMLAESRDRLWTFVVGLRLPYYFWLGLRGFIGAVAWLLVPVSLLAIGSRLPEGAAALVGLVGGLLLAAVLLYLPFLQAHFAAQQRLAAMFELGAVRRLFRRAPIAFWFALLVTLLFTLPLYLLKIELTPRDVSWLPSVVFVMFIFLARLLTGWAMGRARHHEQNRFFLSTWLARLGMLPVVLVYALLVYFTQYLSWYGVWGLYEQHAFLVPAPFLGA